ncbi:MAG: hypothetical protein ABI847_04550, partial [Anaerolineales bacterium]
MIRPHVPFAARYVDYGKVFVPNGALDFSALAYSDDDISRFGPQLFNRGLVFPESSPFAKQIGGITAALLMFEGGYLFSLVQRRREGELSTDPRTDRPFNQVRFVVLTREMIGEAFAARAALYSGLAERARDVGALVWLRDYTTGGAQLAWSPSVERLDPLAPDPEAVRFVANALVEAAGVGAAALPISVPLPPGGDLLEKLRLVEAAQYWVMPRLGVISFALDYVSIQNVSLRLFPLPPDAPAPLPAERVFTPGEGAGRFRHDYFGAVSGLEHDSLYDPALPALLALPIAPAEAVRLFKIEKQAEPFAGAEAQQLYPDLGPLGDRRAGLLRRVPRDELLALLSDPALAPDMRLDLLQAAFEAAHGLLAHYGPAHLAVPRSARDDERVRALLRASLAKSPEAALDLGTPEEQTELYRDMLLARRALPAAGRGPVAPPVPLELSTGQTLLEALMLWRRTPALAAALQEVGQQDASLFGEALAVLDKATDLPGMVWLWRTSGQHDVKHYRALLERVVQPAWYPALAREAATWRELLEDGRALATPPPENGDTQPDAGRLLRSLPRPLVPFVWQASLATAAHDAVFAEWWLFNEAVAVPEQLPALWDALQKLPAGTLPEAGPRLNLMLGRASGMSLLEACAAPGETTADETLYATVLRGWLASGFRSPVGDLALAAEDIVFLVGHLPGSNDILAAVVSSPAQAAAIQAMPAQAALKWAQSAHGARREPYRVDGRDGLFARLLELEMPDEALLWHLLTADDGSAPNVMPWPAYAALACRVSQSAEKLGLPANARLRIYLEEVSALENQAAAETFATYLIDLRQVLALLATHSPDAERGGDLMDGLLPLAVFHLQETSPILKERAAALLRAALQQPAIPSHLHTLPDDVLGYLKENFCKGQPALAPAGHWIDAELLRRHNALRVETPVRTAAIQTRSAMAARPEAEAAPPTASVPPAVLAGVSAALNETRPPVKLAAPPAAAINQVADDPQAAPRAPVRSAPNMDRPVPLVGSLALPGNAPKRRDGAIWLWVLMVVIAVAILAVLIAAVAYIQSLPSAPAALRPLAEFASALTITAGT